MNQRSAQGERRATGCNTGLLGEGKRDDLELVNDEAAGIGSVVRRLDQAGDENPC